jgi:NTP pyrophosphatase (non-canonical NTP hydrolase)
MDLPTYEAFVDEFWAGGSEGYCLIALCGEIGEACNLYKKGMRDHPELRHDPYWQEKMLKELGDVAYYLTKMCHLMGASLETVLQDNQYKLAFRFRHNHPGKKDSADAAPDS